MSTKPIPIKGTREGPRLDLISRPAELQFSPYRVFDREDWARLRADTPMTLLPNELEQLSGLIEELARIGLVGGFGPAGGD